MKILVALCAAVTLVGIIALITSSSTVVGLGGVALAVAGTIGTVKLVRSSQNAAG